MKIRVEFIQDDEEPIEKLARFQLDRLWLLAKRLGICPICTMELMHEMVVNAHERGDIEHTGKVDDDEAPAATHEGTGTQQ